MTTLTVTTLIDAPREVVWHHLTATEAFASWNPFIPQLDGSLTPGARLQVRIAPPGARPMTFRPRVTALEPGRRLEWLGSLGVRGLFDGRHRFVLQDLDPGITQFTQEEEFTGLLAPLTGAMLARTRAGFEAMNEALRTRAEAEVHGSAAGERTPA